MIFFIIVAALIGLYYLMVTANSACVYERVQVIGISVLIAIISELALAVPLVEAMK